MDSWNILKLLEWSTQYFQSKGIESPRLDAEVLLAHCLSLTRVQLYMQFDRPLTEAELQNFKALLKRRSEREPLAYILGKKEFYSMEFIVSPEVLIPRPETELLIEKAIKHFEASSALPHRFLDIGTGSGCIAICLAKNFPQAEIIALDISEQALKIAQQNAQKHGVESQIQFLEIDIFDVILSETKDLVESTGSFTLVQDDRQKKFDLIVSNPPYVKSDEIGKLAPELQFEPLQALSGGEEGLDFYQKLIPWTYSHLNAEGIALFEIGFDQTESIENLATKAGFQKVNILKDYAGHPRMAFLQISAS